MDGSGPGVRFRMLGGIELQAGGRSVDAVLAQPKRVALLTYLLLRRSGGFVPRADLLRVFWPRSTDARARASLRQAVRFLRQHLGSEFIRSRGEGEIGVAEQACRSDANAVLRALALRDDRAAVQAYGGDLLPDFVLPSAPAFEDWLGAERQRLARGVQQALLRLADGAGAPARAEPWLAQALSLEPENEAVARRLMECHRAQGDIPAALGVFEALTQRLHDALDLSPSAATRAVAEALRAGASPGPGTVDPQQSLAPQRILVLPFENLTGDAALDVLGPLAADLLAQPLAGAPDLEVIPALAAGSGGGEDAVETARRLHAGTVVHGVYLRDGAEVVWQPRVTDVASTRLIPGPAAIRTPTSQPLPGLLQLADALARGLAPAASPRVVHVRSAATPPSLDAYAAYLAGLERFGAGRWRDALADFRRAAALHPGYALPRLVAAIAHWNLSELAEAASCAREAARGAGDLGRFERAVLDMVQAWLSGDWVSAYRAARVQAQLAPASIPHFQVAEEARRLNRPGEAIAVLSALDPERGELAGWIYYWVELTVAHHMLGDHGKELELARRCLEQHPNEPIAVLLLVRALAALGEDTGVHDAIDEVLRWPGSHDPSPGELLYEGARELRAHGYAPAGESLLRRALEWYGSRSGAAASPHLMRAVARVHYALDELEPAARLFESLQRGGGRVVQPVGYHHAHLQAHLDAGYLMIIHERTGDRERAEAYRTQLREQDGPFLYGANWYWLAADRAARGHARQAATLLRRAFAEGLPFEAFLHTDRHLQRLRGRPLFDMLMRPDA